MTVAVTGASGFVGRHTVASLLERGHAVRALIHSSGSARPALPSDDRLERVAGDVFEADVLDSLLDGADAVVHTIGIRREIPPDRTFERLHPRAVAAVLDAAKRAGVRRIVHVSALGTRPDAPTEYWRTKYDAEMLVRRSGLEWTILRPSVIHGPDGELIQMIKAWVLGRAAPRFFLPYFTRVEKSEGKFPPRPKLVSAQIQPVHVDDVAAAIADALARDDSVGEVYPLVGPETVDWPALLTTVRDAMPMGDRSKPTRAIPAPLALLVVHVAGVLGLGAALPFGRGEPVMATEDSTASIAKAVAHLGFAPRPFRESVGAYAERI